MPDDQERQREHGPHDGQERDRGERRDEREGREGHDEEKRPDRQIVERDRRADGDPGSASGECGSP